MPIFKFNLHRETFVEPDDIGVEFPDLHRAYIEACRTIPDVSRDLLLSGEDPIGCAFTICDGSGRKLMEVPFADVLSLREWRQVRRVRDGHIHMRNGRLRDDRALTGFGQLFASANAACILLTPDFLVKEINEFGRRHGHVDFDAIRDVSIIDAFDLSDALKTEVTKFWSLPTKGLVSELIDLPYLMSDQNGESIQGWWKARAWPIFDDDDLLVGLAGWSEPSTRPVGDGETIVRLAKC